MLDASFVRDNLDAVRANCRNRNVQADVDAVVRLDGERNRLLLEIALVQYAMHALVGRGYTPVITPDVARAEVLEGIGFIPRGPEAQTYSLAGTDLCLVATAEITLGGMHRDQILDEARLPLQY